MVILHNGKAYNTMSLEAAIMERVKMLAVGKKNVCVLDCSYYGGKKGEYFVTEVEGGENANQ